MISDNRMQMNERFIQAFRLLEERGEIVKNDRNGKGVGDVASKVLGNRMYGHIIRAFLDNKRHIDYDNAQKFCRLYDINEDFVLRGLGNLTSSSESKENQFPDKYYVVAPTEGGNIIFTSFQAFAGTAAFDSGSFARDESTTRFSVPGLSGGNLFAFPINGNSMEPIINSGDIVVCRKLNTPNEIKDNEIYAVRHNGTVWVKYLQPVKNKAGRVIQLKLVSANYLEHDPFIEDVNENTQLFKVIRRISKF